MNRYDLEAARRWVEGYFLPTPYEGLSEQGQERAFEESAHETERIACY